MQVHIHPRLVRPMALVVAIVLVAGAMAPIAQMAAHIMA
jgi:hypothetical protein